MVRHLKNLSICFLCSILSVSLSSAGTVVQLNIQQASQADQVYLKLYDDDKAATVSNFMSYVLDGSYENSFIHRSIPGFVIQGGGFRYDASSSDFIDNFSGIPNKASVVNEPGISNLRATVAMAKLSGQPDSATNQWFINLDDNSTILDDQNEGFTVFGEVMSNGMDVIDQIAGLTTYDRSDIDTAFTDIPLLDYSSDPVLSDNLVQIIGVSELFTVTSSIDSGAVTLSSNVQPEVTIRNTGDEALHVGGIAVVNTVEAPFQVFESGCANSIIQPGEQCAFIVLFTPEAVGIHDDSFDIEIIGHDISYEVFVTGEGAPAVDEADILTSFSSVEFGSVDILASDQDPAYIFNQVVQSKGELDLIISSIEVSGQDARDISISENCTESSGLAPQAHCSILIDFKPLSSGRKEATISVFSNDPDENPHIIPIRANVAGEDDGVTSVLEDLGPNNGDGNYDEIADSRQSKVATIPDINGNYVTYIVDSGLSFRNMSILQLSDVAELPVQLVGGSGIFDFTIEGVSPGQYLELGVILPADLNPDAYYLYGMTVDNPDQHWFDFDFDGETGAIIIGQVGYTSSSDDIVSKNVLRVILKDGGRGDMDMTVNGSVTVTASIAITEISNDTGGGSGSISHLQLLCMMLVLLVHRYLITRFDHSMPRSNKISL